MNHVADQYVIRLTEQHGFLLPTEPEAQAEAAGETLRGLGLDTAESLSDERIVDVAVAVGVELSELADRWAWFDPDTEQYGEGFTSMAEAARVAVMTLSLELD
jgi:hypothetical protein